jgi:hypothetical protein
MNFMGDMQYDRRYARISNEYHSFGDTVTQKAPNQKRGELSRRKSEAMTQQYVEQYLSKRTTLEQQYRS